MSAAIAVADKKRDKAAAMPTPRRREWESVIASSKEPIGEKTGRRIACHDVPFAHEMT
jgi:hypothetical protein